jgi:hypothetical protein
MRAHITHITEADFFPAFYTAFYASMTEMNIQAGFRYTAIDITPLDLGSVLSRQDITLKSPTPPSSRPSTAHPEFQRH